MIRIGDFARLGQVSVVTLRHYDEIGLLKPAVVDSFTGYRFYEPAQLARLNRILALKDLGFSLNQIEDVLGGLTTEQLRGMLKMKEAEAAQQLAVERERLDRIAARLHQIEREGTMPDYEVILKTAPAMLIASRTVTIPTNDQVPNYLGPAFDEAYGHIKSAGVKDAGPCLAIWHQPAAVLKDEVAEAAVPIEREALGTDRVNVYELPEAQVAAVIHQGEFSGMVKAHAVLLSWIESNGYSSLGTYREVYLTAPEAGEPTTEIQYPIAKR